MARRATRRRQASGIGWPAHVRRACGRTRGRTPAPRPTALALAQQRGRHLRGVLSEFVAALLLVMRGYRIVDRRHRSRYGEIDLIAARGRRLAFVEVKYRATIDAAAAAISDRQASRIASAAEQWVWQHPQYHDREIGLDAVLVGRFQLPRHVVNALQPG